ncbi:MAG: flagellar hook-basal body complex protein FliE [Rhodospirillales bacterium RIFCSPLOWO2_12_FULL_58_28]|nr:MAG: flagellar hook-basal body complex protein FliE [Rhodospirillales bacterium RIFCSPLOWO2_02_FULL_58_16]OHC76780.1 MAG: flagellar hook-basal body complex protein FliE [Rhodospirillales bacterium RIFCSPLOWO2_12_FULL_58_28]
MALPVQNITGAINAYASTQRGTALGLGARDAVPVNTFGNLVQNAIQKAIDINKQSESLSIAAINDRADLNQVVTAVSEAELSLQAVTAVRDKVIEAYREILRMPM